MSYGVDIIAKKNQESQIQLSNLDTEHLWIADSSSTLVDGLLSSVADVGTDSTLVPLTQTNANYRPQSGYDKTASYIARLSDVVVDGLNRVSSLANSATTTTRVLASLTQSTDALKPIFNTTDGTLDFYTNNYLVNTMTAKSSKGLTISVYANIPEIVSIIANTERVKFWGNVGSNRFVLYQLAGNTLFFIPAIYEGGVQKISTGYALSAASFNALYANNYHLYTYVIHSTLVEFYIDTTKVYTATVSFNSIDFINTTSTSVFSDLTNVFKLVSSKTYFTPISSYEVGLLYANRDNLTYELPRTGVTSNGSQFMSSLVLPVNTVINTLTVSCWVYLVNILTFATQAEQVICSTDGFTNLATDKGFQLKIQKLTGDLCRFQVQAANGTSIVAANSASLSLSAFKTAYANRWNLVALTVSTDTINDTLTVLVNSVNLASTSATTGIYNTGTGTVLAGARSDGFNIGAGNRIEHLRIDTSKAMDATELYRQMIEDKATYSYLNNS